MWFNLGIRKIEGLGMIQVITFLVGGFIVWWVLMLVLVVIANICISIHSWFEGNH